MKRRAVWGAALTVPLAALVLGVVVAPTLRSPQQVAAEAAPPPPSLVTAQVQRRVVGDTVLFRGTVRPGPNVPLRAPAGLAGDTAVVTDVPVRQGSVIRNGTLVIELAGRPVFAVVSPFPWYRDLVAGDEGPDVEVLQSALRATGQSTATDGVFGPATQSALTAMYAKHGYRLDENAAGPMLPQRAVLTIDRPGRRVTGISTAVGAVLRDPETPLLELDGGAPVVTATVPTDRAGLLQIGQEADLLDETSGGTARLSIEWLGEPVTGQDGLTGVAVRLKFLDEPLPPADRTVRVTVVAAGSREEVNAVPVTAIYSRADGSEFVTVQDATGALVEVTVTTGRSGDGFVELRSPDARLAAGASVVVGTERLAKPSR